MRPIPEEIWALIFAFVREVAQPKSTPEYDVARAIAIRPLSETCKQFRRICLPLIFEAIVLDGSDQASRSKATLLTTILRDASIACTVRTVRVVRWRKPFIPLERDALRALATTLRRLSAVRCVEVRDAAVLSEFINHLPLLPKLDDLSLISTLIVRSEGQPGSSQHLFGTLRHLRLLPTRMDVEFFQATEFVAPYLQSFHTNTTLIENITGIRQIFPHFSDSVRELAITPIGRPTNQRDTVLSELLSLCPRLESLRFPAPTSSPRFHLSHGALVLLSNGPIFLHPTGPLFPPPNDPTILLSIGHNFRLSDGQIAHLRRFEGRSDQVLLWCKGRPLDTIRVTLLPADSTIENCPKLLRPGSVPLRHLHLDGICWGTDTMAFVSRHCPELRSLRVRARTKSETVWMLRPMPRLQRAVFLLTHGAWYGNDYTADHFNGMLGSVHQDWPNLEHFRLHPDYCWKFLGGKDGWSRVQSKEDEENYSESR